MPYDPSPKRVASHMTLGNASDWVNVMNICCVLLYHTGVCLPQYITHAIFLPFLSFSLFLPIFVDVYHLHNRVCVHHQTSRFLVPGWRVGWILIHDKNGAFEEVRTGLKTNWRWFWRQTDRLQFLAPFAELWLWWMIWLKMEAAVFIAHFAELWPWMMCGYWNVDDGWWWLCCQLYSLTVHFFCHF